MPIRKRRQEGIFEDILEERRRCGEVGWLTRSRRLPQYRFAEKDRSPKEFQTVTLDSDRVKFQLARLAEETGQSVQELQKEAEDIMKEMGHELSLRSVKGFGFFLAKVMKRLYRNVFINTEGVMKLRNAVKEYPIVILPSHRSYADFLLMSFLCFDYDLPLPVIAAAMDFASMKFFGSLLRRCGAFFIRRSFASDPLYWLIFTEFVRVHLRSGQHPIEFFLEGTRSRTGKSLVPKTGMLGAILESWFLGEVSDVYLVPVSISYDRILEETLYAYELLGIPKPKESTSGLLKARGILSEDFGDVHFFVHDPISLRGLAEGHVNRSFHNLQPRFSSTLLPVEMQFLKRVAFEIVQAHQREFVISPWCLMATLISQEGSGIDRNLLLRRMEWFRDLLRDVGGRVNWPAGRSTEEVMETQLAIHPGILETNSRGRVSLAKDTDVMSRAARYLQLACYRNHLMPRLVPAAILASAMAAEAWTGRTLIAVGQLRERFDRLLELLHREFVLNPSMSQTTFTDACKDLARRGSFSEHSGTVDLVSSSTPTSRFLARLLAPFVYGYLTALNALWSGMGSSQLSTQEKATAKSLQKFAFDLVERGALEHYDALSLDLLNHCVAVLTKTEVLNARNGAFTIDGGRLRDWREEIKTTYEACKDADHPSLRAKL